MPCVILGGGVFPPFRPPQGLLHTGKQSVSDFKRKQRVPGITKFGDRLHRVSTPLDRRRKPETYGYRLRHPIASQHRVKPLPKGDIDVIRHAFPRRFRFIPSGEAIRKPPPRTSHMLTLRSRAILSTGFSEVKLTVPLLRLRPVQPGLGGMALHPPLYQRCGLAAGRGSTAPGGAKTITRCGNRRSRSVPTWRCCQRGQARARPDGRGRQAGRVSRRGCSRSPGPGQPLTISFSASRSGGSIARFQVSLTLSRSTRRSCWRGCSRCGLRGRRSARRPRCRGRRRSGGGVGGRGRGDGAGGQQAHQRGTDHRSHDPVIAATPTATCPDGTAATPVGDAEGTHG